MLQINPIPPSKVADAVNGAGDKVAILGQSMGSHILVAAMVISGIGLLVGVIIFKLDKRLFLLSLGAIACSVVGYTLMTHSVEVTGIIKGGMNSFFNGLGQPATVQQQSVPNQPVQQSTQVTTQ